MEPYYLILRLPSEEKEEFVLLIPFTPSKKDNLAAWLAARSDPPHYGKLVVYNFPKQKLIYGPRQIEARPTSTCGNPRCSRSMIIARVRRGSMT
jgi:uncharacterized protein